VLSVFFFSSRRRHTRWSVTGVQRVLFRSLLLARDRADQAVAEDVLLGEDDRLLGGEAVLQRQHRAAERAGGQRVESLPVLDCLQIGRASCRERGELSTGQGLGKRESEGWR